MSFDIDDAVKTEKFFQFFGINENCFKIGPHVLEALEDPQDGWRSCMDELKEIDRKEG